MKRKVKLVFYTFSLISLLTGCFQVRPKNILIHPDLNKEFQMGKYVSKVDNFIIILDSSSSMNVVYENMANLGYSKFMAAKDIIRQMIYTIPEMNINGALQTFGYVSLKPIKYTETVYGLTTFSRSGLVQSLNNIKSPVEGNSPAGLAIEAVNDALKGTKGKSAVILISDGEYLENDPMAKFKELKNSYGDRICLYTIWVGNILAGKTYMEELAGGMECGFSTSASEIASREDMTNFVIKVFLARDKDSDGDGVYDAIDKCPDTPYGTEVDESGCPEVRRLDSDGDGVYDDLDKCPDTPYGIEVDESGCPKVSRLDSDGDGVYDDLDKCPDTPYGIEVDETGCPKVSRLDSDGDGVYDDLDECPDTPRGAIVDSRGCWLVKGVNFEYKKWNVQPQFNSNLNNIVKILEENPELKIRIEGHTDNIGSMEYNMKLSMRRAQSIKDYLVDKGIDPSRITFTGFGFSQPIASNDTSEGRALNRRAEIIPVK